MKTQGEIQSIKMSNQMRQCMYVSTSITQKKNVTCAVKCKDSDQEGAIKA